MASDMAELITRGGLRLHVRTAEPADEVLLAEFFRNVAPDDLRFRFLTGLNQVRREQLMAMLSVDHERTETLLAFDPGQDKLVAVAMLAGDEQLHTAEVAISVRADCKHKGVGWTLLDHVLRFAEQRGFSAVISIESRANREAIELEREMGFSVEEVPGDPTLVIVRRPLSAAARPARAS